MESQGPTSSSDSESSIAGGVRLWSIWCGRQRPASGSNRLPAQGKAPHHLYDVRSSRVWTSFYRDMACSVCVSLERSTGRFICPSLHPIVLLADDRCPLLLRWTMRIVPLSPCCPVRCLNLLFQWCIRELRRSFMVVSFGSPATWSRSMFRAAETLVRLFVCRIRHECEVARTWCRQGGGIARAVVRCC